VIFDNNRRARESGQNTQPFWFPSFQPSQQKADKNSRNQSNYNQYVPVNNLALGKLENIPTFEQFLDPPNPKGLLHTNSPESNSKAFLTFSHYMITKEQARKIMHHRQKYHSLVPTNPVNSLSYPSALL
jgi:hypothetical protein